jgi:adenylate cyclase
VNAAPTSPDTPSYGAIAGRFGLAHVAGGLLTWVYFSIPLSDADRVGNENQASLWVLVAYLVFAGLCSWAVGQRLRRPVDRWFDEGRAPTVGERRQTFLVPARLALCSFLLWVGAAALFGVLNAGPFGNPGSYVARVVVGVVLGGLTSSAIGYLAVERAMRPVFAVALAASPPSQPEGPGVAHRLLLTWLLGSAVPLLFIAITFIGGQDRAHLQRAILFLVALGVFTGGITTWIAARSVAGPVSDVTTGLQRVRGGTLGVAVTVDDACEVGVLQAGFNAMVAGLAERELLRDLFGRHVGVEVARRALKAGPRLGGELREASAMFVDLTGSTALAQRERPETVVGILNEFFAVVVGATTAEGGWVNKFEGDAALCVFGAPEEQPDHAARALRAARRLREELTELARRHPVRLDAGIGVSCGEVVAGNVGVAERYEYTVVGDPVNEAARLTELAKAAPTRLLASESVVAAAGEEASHWRPGPQTVLRGRSDVTTLYEPVAAASGTPSPCDARQGEAMAPDHH